MDPAAFMLVAVLVSAPIGIAWVEIWRRIDALREKRATCLHSWKEPIKAAAGYKVFCALCGIQEFAHADGTLCPFPCETCGRGVR